MHITECPLDLTLGCKWRSVRRGYPNLVTSMDMSSKVNIKIYLSIGRFIFSWKFGQVGGHMREIKFNRNHLTRLVPKMIMNVNRNPMRAMEIWELSGSRSLLENKALWSQQFGRNKHVPPSFSVQPTQLEPPKEFAKSLAIFLGL